MLNSVRYGAERDCVRNVHWLQALAAATSIVSSAPSSSSAAKSTAYDTDIVEPLVASGRLTFSADAMDEKSSSARKRPGLGDGVRGEQDTTSACGQNSHDTVRRLGNSLQPPQTNFGRLRASAGEPTCR